MIIKVWREEDYLMMMCKIKAEATFPYHNDQIKFCYTMHVTQDMLSWSPEDVRSFYIEGWQSRFLSACSQLQMPSGEAESLAEQGVYQLLKIFTEHQTPLSSGKTYGNKKYGPSPEFALETSESNEQSIVDGTQVPKKQLNGFSALSKKLPAQEEAVEYPCQCFVFDRPDGRSISYSGKMRQVVIHLNDAHKEWTREKIADWLDDLHDRGLINIEF